MTDYHALSDFDPAPTERELASEIKQRSPPRPDSPTRDEISGALDQLRSNIRAEVRNEATASEKRLVEVCMTAVGEVLVKERKRMRAEIETEVLRLRAEFLQGQLDAERGVRRLKPVG
jgi:hypothetical protein